MSADDVVQLYAMRIALESLAVRVSVPQLSASDLDGLAAALDELDRALERRAPDAIEAASRNDHGK